jgi:hypothetical protein
LELARTVIVAGLRLPLFSAASSLDWHSHLHFFLNQPEVNMESLLMRLMILVAVSKLGGPFWRHG